MGKLSHLKQDLGVIQSRLQAADRSEDVRRDELDGLLDSRFNNTGDRLEGALNRLLSESDKAQNTKLTRAVNGVIDAINQSHQSLYAAIHGSLNSNAQSVADAVESITGRMGASGDTLAGQINELTASVTSLPQSFPEQKPVDLAPVQRALDGVLSAVQERPEPLLPQIDQLTETVQQMDEKIGKRVYSFEVHRSPITELIESITVTEK